MAGDEYEILPHQLLSDLKYDVEALKKKLTQPDTKINELILEIESMKDSIHELNVVFEKALEETKEEDVSKIVRTLNERLETVVSQNEIIAKGMIAISDKLEDFMQKQSTTAGGMMQRPIAPAQHTIGMPSMSGPGRVAPRPEQAMESPPMMMGEMNFPPPPPNANGGAKKSRVGLFK
ncbi:MAG: hypothetical protein ABH824_00045 [Nanoarchaeota archaeon]|nr:hypothetical protein [Nanoarchaeota archaeon]MBU1631600.1 hypothetical protein [Nanoarchaeota archaeon]MBU1876026.1 hypothetical protein [Nanoarchaeota archaeon]